MSLLFVASLLVHGAVFGLVVFRLGLGSELNLPLPEQNFSIELVFGLPGSASPQPEKVQSARRIEDTKPAKRLEAVSERAVLTPVARALLVTPPQASRAADRSAATRRDETTGARASTEVTTPADIDAEQASTKSTNSAIAAKEQEVAAADKISVATADNLVAAVLATEDEVEARIVAGGTSLERSEPPLPARSDRGVTAPAVEPTNVGVAVTEAETASVADEPPLRESEVALAAVSQATAATPADETVRERRDEVKTVRPQADVVVSVKEFDDREVEADAPTRFGIMAIDRQAATELILKGALLPMVPNKPFGD